MQLIFTPLLFMIFTFHILTSFNRYGVYSRGNVYIVFYIKTGHQLKHSIYSGTIYKLRQF